MTYRYFAQSQYNVVDKRVVGYEFLIRERQNGAWCLPTNFADIPSSVIIENLIREAKPLAKSVQTISLNLNRTELMDSKLIQKLIEVQTVVEPLKMVIELTEEEVHYAIAHEDLLAQLLVIKRAGLEISLDDVGTGANTFENVRKFLPISTEIKFALQNFTDGITSPAMQQRIIKWQKVGVYYHQRFFIEGIETSNDDEVATRLGINYRQGFYYDKPHLLS